jgi:glutaredoxin
MTVPRITLLARPGCHLCDDAREVISKVADDLGVTWEERDITQSEADLREYWEQIPVTLVDGVPHDFWRVSEDRLRRALRLSPGPAAAAGRVVGDFVHLFTNDVW